MLILARKHNEKIMIGDDVEVSVVEIKGDQVKLGISAPRDVKVYRAEVYEAIQEENRAAAAARAIPEIEIFSQGSSDSSEESPPNPAGERGSFESSSEKGKTSPADSRGTTQSRSRE